MSIEGRSRLGRDPWFRAGSVLAAVLLGLALVGPWAVPHSPGDAAFAPLSPPGGGHWLGTDDGGMDIGAVLVHAVGNTALFGLSAGFAALALGAGIGLACAWVGGWADRIGMRAADVLLAIPSVMVLILVAAFVRLAPPLLALVLAGLIWPTTAKGIRAQALTLRSRLHLRAVRQMGASGIYLMRRHLLPELFPLMLVGFVGKVRMAMFLEASLAFLGLFDPEYPSLGKMIREAARFYYLDVWWHWLVPPVACLTLLLMAPTFLAVSLEQVLDPRLREVSR